jgi:hypothetical protein
MAFADDIKVRFLKGKGSPAPEAPDAPSQSSDDEDAPGAKGKMLAAALKRGDGAAIEEAVRAICG